MAKLNSYAANLKQFKLNLHIFILSSDIAPA